MGILPSRLQSGYQSPITRGDFTALAVALYESTMGVTITGRQAFDDDGDDVNIRKMGYLRVVTGADYGLFLPHNHINRQEAAAILARLADAINRPLPPAAPTFADNAQIADWAMSHVGQVQHAGIMGGVEDNMFAPFETYTLEQSIATLLRLLR